MSRQLTVAAAQMGPVQRADTRSQVVDRLIAMLNQAHEAGATLVVFPELALTTFFPRWVIDDPEELDSYFEAEMPNNETQPLFAAAQELGIGFHLGYAEMVIEDDGSKRYFNTAILVDREGQDRREVPQGSYPRPRRAAARPGPPASWRSATSSPATWAFPCSAPWTASWECASATTGAGRRPTG